jgi:hypothetical protein
VVIEAKSSMEAKVEAADQTHPPRPPSRKFGEYEYCFDCRAFVKLNIGVRRKSI